MNSGRLLTILLAGGLVLPVVLAVLVGLARLLAAMDDPHGADVAGRLALACGTLWAIDLICLVLVVALDALVRRGPDA